MEQLRRMPEPSRVDLEIAARSYFDREAAGFTTAREPIENDHELGYNADLTRTRIQELEDQLQRDQFDGRIQGSAAELVRAAGGAPAEIDPQRWAEAVRLAARAERTSMQLLLHLLTKPWARFEPDDVVFGHAISTIHPAPLASPSPIQADGPTVEQSAGRYLERKRLAKLGSSQLDEIARALRWLGEVVGRQTPIDLVSKDQLRSFRDQIERLDSRLKGREASFAARQTADEEHWITSATATRYWRSVQAFLGWCAAEGLASADRSEGLKIAKRRDEAPQSPEPFSPAELKALFATPLFAGHKSPKQPLTPGGCVERGSYWFAGLIALYTGMRAGEIAQLLFDDFDFAAEVPVIHVRTEDGTGKKVKLAKTASSVRDVPIADMLLKLGLRDFVEARHKRWKAGRIFPDISFGTKDRRSDGMSKFWGRLLKASGLHKPGRSIHVTRHTATAAMRAAAVPEDVIGAVLGHAPAKITGHYGGQYPAHRLAAAVNAIDYGFDVLAALGGPFDPKRHAA